MSILEESDRPLSPIEITKQGRLNHNSVRAYLSIMLKSGEVQKKFYGNYIITPTYGVGITEPVFAQNLTFVAEGLDLKFLTEGIIRAVGFDYLRGQGWVKMFQHMDDSTSPPEFFRVRTQLGRKRNKVTWTVAAPKGIDYYGMVLCRHIVEENLSRLGLSFENFGTQFVSKNVELLKDYYGLRVEGLQGVTLTNFYGQMEKIYNKVYGVRHEVRDSSPTPFNEVMAVMYGGMAYSQVITGVGMITKDVATIVESNKGLNRTLGDFTHQVTKGMNLLLESQFKLIDKVDKLEEKLE